MTLKPILGISLALVMFLGTTSLVFAESLKDQLEHGLEIDQLQCNNPDHVLVERTNGNPACVTEKTAERVGWEIISTHSSMADSNDVDNLTNTDPIVEEITEEEHNEKIVTPIQNTEKEISSERLMVEPLVSSDQNNYVQAGSICPHLNTLSLDVPVQANIGEEFDVILSYSYILPDAGNQDDYENYEYRLETELKEVCQADKGLSTTKETFMKVLDIDFVGPSAEYSTWTHDWSFDPPKLPSGGFLNIEFNNDMPQQKTVTLQIDQPRFDNNYGGLTFSSMTLGSVSIFYEINDGIVTFNNDVQRIEIDDEILAGTNTQNYYEVNALSEAYQNQYVKITNSTYNLEKIVERTKEPIRIDRPYLAEGQHIPTSVDYGFWIMQSHLDIDDRVANIEETAQLYAQYYPQEINAEDWANAIYDTYPEIKTQSGPAIIEFPRHMSELVGWLKGYPNGFAEIYLTEKTFSPDALNRLNPSFSQATAAVQGVVPQADFDLKNLIFSEHPELQTTPENQNDVDRILQKEAPLTVDGKVT